MVPVDLQVSQRLAKYSETLVSEAVRDEMLCAKHQATYETFEM